MQFLKPLMICALASAGPAIADNVALLVGNEDYANGRDISGADEILDAGPALRAAGFTVIALEDATAAALQQALDDFSAVADGSGSIVIALSGHVVQSQTLSWFLGADADAPSIGSVNASGLPLDLVIEIAARAPGKSVVLIGTEDRGIDLGDGVERGMGDLRLPQGVTLITGSADDIADFAKDAVPRSGVSLATAVDDWPAELEIDGFVAPLTAFVDAELGQTVRPDPAAADRAFWSASQAINTRQAFEGYLQRYPNGVFAPRAREAIAAIEAQPALQAEAEERQLSLSRDDRREIQRSLSLIGFDPRGIDGVFGRGSRAAITAFQQANRMQATGFVTRAMFDELQVQADRRSAELEEQARLQKVELERRDRRYWEQTGAQGDEAGLRAYLDRYPDGVFAEIALARLEPFEASRRAQAQAQDRDAWDRASASGTPDAYRRYIRANPNGAFVDQANAKIAEAQQARQNAGAREQAKRVEDSLALNPTTRRLIEDRLDKLDLKPGVVDGEFDDNTRRAIRRYQEVRNIPNTGYINQGTIVRLLADTILR